MGNKYQGWITRFLTDRGEYTFSKELFCESVGDLAGLFVAHHDELGFVEGLKLDLDLDMYRELEEVHELQLLVVRYRTKPVGYAIYMVGPDPRYKGRIDAQQDVLYVAKEHRGAGIGFKFIEYCDDVLMELGVEAIWCSSNNKLDIGKFYERLGYKFVEKIYLRRIEP